MNTPVSRDSAIEKEAGWRPMSTAPQDGTEIQADIPGERSDAVIAWQDGYMDENEKPCSCWVFTRCQEPPDDWTDGVCWAVNADGEKSTQPTRWKPLSPDPQP